MGSTGVSKWTKYFRGKNVDTVVKAPAAGVPIFKLDGKTKLGVLKHGDPITVLDMKEWPAKGPHYTVNAKIGSKTVTGKLNDAAVDKPRKKGPKKADITASDFIKYGKKEVLKYNGDDWEFMTFPNVKMLQDSILKCMKERSDIPSATYDAFEEFFKNGMKKPMRWTKNIKPEEIKSYGVYLGELLIGLIVLAKLDGQFIEGVNPFRGKTITKFCMPIASNFSGVDSLFMTSKGEIIGVSSKFGAGAKASVFSNIFPKAMAHFKDIKPCIFKTFVKAALDLGLDEKTIGRNGKSVCYAHGIYDILKLKKGAGKKEIQDPLVEVYEPVIKNKIGPKTLMVLEEVAKTKGDLKTVVDTVMPKMPAGITAFFCRAIAWRLNHDKTSIEEMKKILAGKDYFQANLQTTPWEKQGVVKFKMLNSGKVELSIIGSKAPIDDTAGKQGLVNYELKYS